MVKKIRKRDGSVVSFHEDKISDAIWKAARAVGGNDKERPMQLARLVVKKLEKVYGEYGIPEVEAVQDLVEKILIEEGHAKVAKAYILYRRSHDELRKVKGLFDTIEAVEDYIGLSDWMVKENSNMGFSLQGLNNYIGSKIIANYWMRRVYPEAIRKAHEAGDLHVHDLSCLGAYCVGWDLKDLLTVGFRGVKGKVESNPPKHLAPALGQIVNFFYTLQGESAGAQAFSNFDTLLAPFIRYDNLNYKQVKKLVQSFLFNMAVPTRVGFQCISEDTEILTPNGWVGYDEVKKGDMIKTFNIKEGVIEDKVVKKLFKKEYKGVMYNLKNRIQDQLISPGHRVVRKKFGGGYVLEEIEKVKERKSPFIVPIAGENVKKDIGISNEQIKLMAWVIGEGTIEKPGRNRCYHRVSIYQSKIMNSNNYKEIKELLDYYKFNYSEYTQKGLGKPVQRFRLNAESSRVIHRWFGAKDSVGFIPKFLVNMSKRQSRLFLNAYLKAEGFEGCKIATTSSEVLDDLQMIAVNAGYGTSVLVRKPTIGTKMIYVLRLIKHKDSYIQKVEEVDYDGVIWCPNTDNETVIARRNGKVFVTGNTPFTNVTMDLEVPEYMKNEHVIIGGQPQVETYKEFKKEMDMFNRAFAECMLEGDSSGQVFTFPIPTYNIIKNFDFDNPEYDLIWEMTAKYGIPYFSNFVNSDMKPEDTRSMCPLAGDEKVLIRSSRGRGLEFGEIRNIFKSNSRSDEYDIYSDGKFVKGKFNSFGNQKMLKVTLKNGHNVKMSREHLNFVFDSEEKILKGSELKEGMYLPYSLNKYKGEGGSNELGYFVGAYAGDGSFNEETSVVFSLEKNFKKHVIDRLIEIGKNNFGAGISVIESKKSKLVTLKIHSRAAVGLCRDYVKGIKREKHYRARLFGSSLEFREGVLEGHYDTDGGNRGRIYTSSKKMINSLNMLAATLGTTTSVYEDDREGRYGSESNFAVLVYRLNRKKYGDVWFKKNNKLWVKIRNIKEISVGTAYCFEVKSGEPVFTVGTTGILTHNCRLRLETSELKKRGGGLFGSNPQTGCYDDKTEILTENGWKLFKNLNKTERVFTLDSNNKIELHRPRKYFEYKYDGDLVRFKNRMIDLLVTPNHRMVVDQVGSWKRKFVEAKDFDINNQRIPKRGEWEREDVDYFILPGIEFTKYGRQGRTPYNIKRDSLKIKMDDWLKFFGFWVAEGCIDNESIAKSHGYRVVVSQKNKENRKDFEKVLMALPFNYSKEGINYVICNKQLWTYLRQFGKKYDKFLPMEIKALSKRQLKILFDWIMRGDEHIRKMNGQMNYWTSSKRLANDVQEIVLKLGMNASVTVKEGGASVIKRRMVKSNRIYIIGVQRGRHCRLRKNNIGLEKYKGKVYCCEVENHSVFVRRNGKSCWCGNSIGVVTVNMARLGYVSTSEDDFMGRLDRLMELAKESLEIKRKTIERFTDVGLYPYSKFYLRQIYQRFGQYWKNHFSTIGLLGMNEAILNFMPGESITTEKGRGFALRVLDFMREKLEEFQEETGSIYNLEATPGEGTTYRFARMDKKRFGRILVANEEAVQKGAEPYYTNSSHLPVNYTNDVFEALDLQDELQCKYTGGTVFHTFVGERMTKDSVKKMVKKISDNYHLPYFTITPTFSICPVHGYLAGEHEYCPKCDADIEQAEQAEKEKVELVEEKVENENTERESGDGELSVATKKDVEIIEPVVSVKSKLNIGGDYGEDKV